MANLAGWPYWKVVSITGQSGAGVDYQVELEIGDSAGGDFHLEGHCTNFPQDIRITDDDGTTLLDHFVEDLTADPIVVHVEVKDDLGSNRDIRVYYGKSGESTASNITNTFPDFSDDFPGSSLDTSKWDETGTVSVSSSTVTLDSTDIIKSDLQNFPVNTSCKFRMQMDNYTLVSLVGYWLASTENERALFYSDMGNDNQYGTQSQTGSNWNNRIQLGTGYTGWHTWEIKRNGFSSNIFFIDESNVGTMSSGIPLGSMGLILNSTSGVTMTVDWVVIKKYNSPEPAFSSAGAEQTPTGVAPTGVLYGPLVGPFGGPL